DVSYKSKEEKKEKNNYKYPHDYGGYVRQQYLPDSLKDRQYYQPTDNGFEAEIKTFRKQKEAFIRSKEEQ
ncbi:MAG: replication-associated recombination protein A, partial [Clostridia bacterium]|nr:replication-associated recombination protein A [Clostridia bacterium]